MVAAGTGGESAADGPPRPGRGDPGRSWPPTIPKRSRPASGSRWTVATIEAAERLLARARRPIRRWPGSAAGWRCRGATPRRPSATFAIASELQPDSREAVTGLITALGLQGDAKAAAPLREIAARLDHLQALIQRAAPGRDATTPSCRSCSAMPARPCTATTRPAAGTRWPSPATRSTPGRSVPCTTWEPPAGGSRVGPEVEALFVGWLCFDAHTLTECGRAECGLTERGADRIAPHSASPYS